MSGAISTAMITTIVSFLPVFTMERRKGRCSRLGLHQDVCFGFRLRAGIDLASFPIVLVVLDKDPFKADTENTELPVDRGRNRLTYYLWQYSRYRANGSRVE